MYITGPAVIKSVTGETVGMEELGGAMTHAQRTGNCHFVAKSDKECIEQVRELLSYLPQSNDKSTLPVVETADPADRTEQELVTLMPDNPNRAYSMKKVISKVVDNGQFMEVHKHFARNLLVGFARMEGRTVGIVAQEPMYMAGVIDVDASDKGARFVRLCDCFNIPVVTFVDVPGYMPGTDQEYKGIIRHGAKFLYAYAEATVPKISVIVRKAYGGAYIVMSSKCLRGDINYAWPSAEIAVMGPEGAANIVFKDAIEKSDSPDETRQRLVEDYRSKFANPYVAAGKGYLDDVIDPSSTRPRIIEALRMLRSKTAGLPYKKHGNIPL